MSSRTKRSGLLTFHRPSIHLETVPIPVLKPESKQYVTVEDIITWCYSHLESGDVCIIYSTTRPRRCESGTRSLGRRPCLLRCSSGDMETYTFYSAGESS